MKEILQLYKEIRRLHRRLPADMKYIGNRYLNQEFRLHVNAKKSHLEQFQNEWNTYRVELKKQLDSEDLIGKKLDVKSLDELSPDQLGQLLELRTSSKNIK